MTRKIRKKERKCLIDCVEESRQCVEEKDGEKAEACKVDYAKCLESCKIKHL